METTSLGAMLRATAQRVPNRVALHEPAPGGAFIPISYAELLTKVESRAGTLHEAGLRRGDRLAIVAESSVEWAISDWAAQSLGLVVVTVFSTLTAEQVQFIVRDSGAKAVLAGDANQAAKVAELPDVRVIPLDEIEILDVEAEGMLGSEELKEITASVRPDDLATLIYTSGTTGQPKGVMLSHRAQLHVCASAKEAIALSEDDVFFSFLPMSHVYEKVAGQVLPIYLGASIAYARSLAGIANDLLKVRPTVMLCVPRFLESFRDRVYDTVSKAPPLRQKLFHAAISQGAKRAKGQSAPFAGVLSKIVASKIVARTGGRMRYFVSGGAALAPHVAEFYMALGLTVLQGYGLSESSGGNAINRPDNNRYWTVGEPLGTEIKLAEDGEILLRGPSIMTGYWKLPQETASALDAEGWLHTGDIGEWDEAGKRPTLRITDRKKDLLVLGNGKNVAPQPIENRLKESEFVQEAVLFGDGVEYVAAILLPATEAVRKRLGLASTVPLEGNEAVRKLMKTEVDRVNANLAPFERVKKFTVLERTFSIETGELTPTLKVKRRVVREKYADALRELGLEG